MVPFEGFDARKDSEPMEKQDSGIYIKLTGISFNRKMSKDLDGNKIIKFSVSTDSIVTDFEIPCLLV